MTFAIVGFGRLDPAGCHVRDEVDEQVGIA